MTLRLRAHREVLEEYLVSIGNYGQQDISGVCVQYDDEDDSLPRAIHPSDEALPPLPFDVLRSANTLAMLLQVFGDTVRHNESTTVANRGALTASLPASPARLSAIAPLSPRAVYGTYGGAVGNSAASPSSYTNSSTSPAAGTGVIDCWVDEGEVAMSTEALRRFRAVAGIPMHGSGGVGSLLGKGLVMPPELIDTPTDEDEDDMPIIATGAHTEVMPTGGSQDPMPLDGVPIPVTIVRPPCTIVYQRPLQKPAGGPFASSSIKSMPPVTGTSVGIETSSLKPEKKEALNQSSPANIDTPIAALKTTAADTPPTSTSVAPADGQQEALVADIQRMVAEMRQNAFSMKESLQVEAHVMRDASDLLQTATEKTKAQTQKVDALEGGGAGGHFANTAVASLLRKVLPAAVVSMLLNSLGAIVALIKTMLWVLLILGITSGTLFVILMRRKATAITVEEVEYRGDL